MKVKFKLKKEDDECIVIEKDCTMACMCFCRPVFDVHLTWNGNKTYIGKIVYPWNPCDFVFKVYDASDNLKFIIEANCCQLGFCFDNVGFCN